MRSRAVENVLKIWCLLRDQQAHVLPVQHFLGSQAEFVFDRHWNPDQLVRAMPDVVICVNDYHYDVARCLAAARLARIPSLVLQDGILEWRCQYENPLFGMGGGAPQHQPVLADKIACIGHQSYRQLVMWGNAAKAEITGMPKLDYLLGHQWQPILRPGTRLLVMTAKNPGFTPAQRAVTVQSLRDVKEHLESLTQLQITWRVSRNVAEQLGVVNQMRDTSSAELSKLLNIVDAVITTPSTTLLESMLSDRPVAVLDYHNVPRIMNSAWTISAQQHIEPVVRELLNPPVHKMTFQRGCLADALRMDGPAATHVGALVQKLAAIGRAARCLGQPLNLAPDLIGGSRIFQYFPLPPLSSLYPETPVFQEQSVQLLRLNLARAENELGRVRAESAELHDSGSLLRRLSRVWSGVRRSVIPIEMGRP